MAVRTLLAAAATLAFFQGTSATLDQAFTTATDPLSPPEHSAYFYISNATATKLQLQSVFEAYLVDMGSTIDMMAGRTIRQLYQQESNYFKNFEYSSLHPEELTATAFDWTLPNVAAFYRRLVALVQNGASASSRASPQQASPKLSLRAYSEWSPEDSYVNLPGVVGNGISELQFWANNFLETGLSAANSEVAAIMKQKREEELIPYVQSAQSNARRASESYDYLFQQHSSLEVYQDFAAARQELWNVQLVA